MPNGLIETILNLLFLIILFVTFFQVINTGLKIWKVCSIGPSSSLPTGKGNGGYFESSIQDPAKARLNFGFVCSDTLLYLYAYL